MIDSIVKLVSFLPVLSVARTESASAPIVIERQEPPITFNWSLIEPSPELRYHDCYDQFKCARLMMPMDWPNISANTHHDPTVAIAIVMLPARVPITDPTFGGTVFINPGGPGEPGTTYVVSAGRSIQASLDGEKRYEILSFDPRGVLNTTPHADCYNGDVAALVDQFWHTRGYAPLHKNLQDYRMFSQGLGQLCEQASPEILPHISSASAARDMVEILDRVEELRRNEVANTEAKRSWTTTPKLMFMGYSYGTVLGMTFASMFPDRVGRMMLDGVLDIDDYTQGAWRESLNDAELIVNLFYQQCFDAGDQCALKSSLDATWTDIKARVDTYLSGIEASPVPIIHNNRVTLLTTDDIRFSIFFALYVPAIFFADLGKGLAEILAGNYSSITARFPIEDGTLPGYSYPWVVGAHHAIVFSDTTANVSERGLAYFEEYSRYIQAQSPTVGTRLLEGSSMALVGRKIRPKYAFEGPYTMPRPDPENPSSPQAPILFLSSQYDPITPLANAFKMAERFLGSVVGVREGAGHTTSSSPSDCITRMVREYFQTGKMPENGTVCEQDCHPFKGCTGPNTVERGLRRNLPFTRPSVLLGLEGRNRAAWKDEYWTIFGSRFKSM